MSEQLLRASRRQVGTRRVKKCCLHKNHSGQRNQSQRTHLDWDFFANPGPMMDRAQGLVKSSISHLGPVKATSRVRI